MRHQSRSAGLAHYLGFPSFSRRDTSLTCQRRRCPGDLDATISTAPSAENAPWKGCVAYVDYYDDTPTDSRSTMFMTLGNVIVDYVGDSRCSSPRSCPVAALLSWCMEGNGCAQVFHDDQNDGGAMPRTRIGALSHPNRELPCTWLQLR